MDSQIQLKPVKPRARYIPNHYSGFGGYWQVYEIYKGYERNFYGHKELPKAIEKFYRHAHSKQAR